MDRGVLIVFEGPEDYHHNIDDPKLKIDENTMLFIRGVGPVGYPGSAEVVNMQPPDALIKRGILSLPCIGGLIGSRLAGRLVAAGWSKLSCCCADPSAPSAPIPTP